MFLCWQFPSKSKWQAHICQPTGKGSHILSYPLSHFIVCFSFLLLPFSTSCSFSAFSSPVPYCQNCTFTKSCQTGCVTWYIVSKRKIKLYFRILFGVHYIELFLLSISIEKTSVIQYTSLIYFEFSCFKYLGQFLIRLLISPILFFFFFFFFWPHPQHIEVPWPGIKSEKQLWPAPQLQQHQIL